MLLCILNTFILFAEEMSVEAPSSTFTTVSAKSIESVLEMADVIVTTIEQHYVVEDNSGLSIDEVREIVAEDDLRVMRQAVKEIARKLEDNVTISKEVKKEAGESLYVTPDSHDWIQTKSGEWFKGEIKALYDKKLEFHSDEIGHHTFKFKHITQIKSHHVISVYIEGVASFPGIIRMKDDNITIFQGHGQFDFPREQIVSAAPRHLFERDRWTGKASVSIDKRTGNKEQFDYTATASLKRRTVDTRLRLDYIGRISRLDDSEISDDHRINESYDLYVTRKTFWNAIFSEYYKDKFQNIKGQYTVGTGIGQTLIDNSKTEWHVSTGPALIYTRHETVGEGESNAHLAAAWELNTDLDQELTKMTDLKLSHKLTYTDADAGRYKHHMVFTFENELTSWLDLDVGFIWDYIRRPKEMSDGTVPEKSDLHFLVSLGVGF